MSSVRKLKNSALRHDVFILGNGPSIGELDLRRLAGKTIIGMNASTLLDEQYGFSSRYYVLSDARFLNNPEKRQLATTRLAPSVKRVLRSDLREHDVPDFSHRTHYVRVLGKNGYSHDLAKGYFFGCTTTMLALQLASYIGARRIYLLGTDFKYDKQQKRFYPEDKPDPVDPFLSVQLWNMRNSYRELSNRSVSIFHCSPKSNLTPYIPYADFDTVT